jgi:hypothetical protein
VIREADAESELAKLYDELRSVQTGVVDKGLAYPQPATRMAALSARERAIFEYVFKLTLEPMRSAGLSDREILDVDLIVSYVAYRQAAR